MVEAALRLLGIDFPVTDDGNNMRESRPDPSLEDHPEVGPPPQMSQAASDARRASLEATCDAVVHRALERAGNRLRNNTTVRPEGVEPDEMHLFVKARTGQMDSLLDGAWSCLPKLLRGQPHSHEAVSRALDAYTRSLLDGQQQHDPDTMMRFVDAGISAAA
jgi:DNA-binding TFAR19-related protein (PDSD5 family)